MARSRFAALMGVLFLVCFCFAGVTGQTTVKEVTAVAEMTLPQLFFSLSSASILLIPLAIATMIAAVIAYLSGRRNVGFAFSLVSFLAFAGFMLLFARENTNSALYSPLSEALKEGGIKKLKKRDVDDIIVTYAPLVYLALACAGAAVCLGFPKFRTKTDRIMLRKDLLPYA
jgi:hypothetical protein